MPETSAETAIEQVFTPSAIEIPVAEFEGEYIRQFKGKVNLPVFEMDRGYARGTHLKIAIELRVRDVSVTEDRRGDLTREHTFALEQIELLGAYSADQMDPGVGGNAAASALPDWVGPFVKFVEDGTPMDWNEVEIPDALMEMIDAYFDSESDRVYNEVDDGPVDTAAESEVSEPSDLSDLSEYADDYIAQDHEGEKEDVGF